MELVVNKWVCSRQERRNSIKRKDIHFVVVIAVPPIRCVRCSVELSACQSEECFGDRVKVPHVSVQFRLALGPRN